MVHSLQTTFRIVVASFKQNRPQPAGS